MVASSRKGATRLRVAVGMSGGVDSSLAAYLLKQAGHDVVGVFIRSWEDDGNCPAGEDAAAAAAAADYIGIELEAIDCVAEYRQQVFEDFLAELRAGRTPNPDVWCNAVIKFQAFADFALGGRGFDAIATGHYARVGPGGATLLKAEDEGKDQTYFLYRMPRERLAKVMFPLGGMRKRAVKRKAREAGLPTADRKESMGICFIGKRPFRDFVSSYIERRPGDFVDATGKTVGRHEGAHLYTIGQRHGLGLGGEGKPWYVSAKDNAANAVTVVRGREDRALLSNWMRLTRCHWISRRDVHRNWVYSCRYRHRMEPAPCALEEMGETTATVSFAQPQWGVAPGQAGVIYDGLICLGGGTIEAAGK